MAQKNTPHGYGIRLLLPDNTITDMTVRLEADRISNTSQGFADWVRNVYIIKKNDIQDRTTEQIEELVNPLHSFHSLKWVLNTTYRRTKKGRLISIRTYLYIVVGLFLLALAAVIFLPTIILRAML